MEEAHVWLYNFDGLKAAALGGSHDKCSLRLIPKQDSDNLPVDHFSPSKRFLPEKFIPAQESYRVSAKRENRGPLWRVNSRL
jgi:hypothetical protein